MAGAGDDVDGSVLAAAAEHLRGLLVELDDPDDELTATPATRRRIEGAAIALDVAVGGSSGDDTLSR